MICYIEGKKGITVTNAIQENLEESRRKLNTIFIDQSNKFYNRSIKSWLNDNVIKRYSTHNKTKSVVAEVFIRTLKTKTCKQMTAISKNVYICMVDKILANTGKCIIEQSKSNQLILTWITI